MSHRAGIYLASVKNQLLNIEDLFSTKLHACDFKACAAVGPVGDANIPAVSFNDLLHDEPVIEEFTRLSE